MSLPKKKLGLKIRAVRNSIEPEETWLTLQTGLEQIYNKNASTLSFEELYRTAYNLVLYKHGQLVYDRVQATIQGYQASVLKSRILPLVSESSLNSLGGDPSRATDFLLQLKEVWEEHSLCLQMIRDVLMYLDRTFVKNSKIPDVYQLGQTLFRNVILLHSSVKDFLAASLLKQISLERQGELIDLFLMKKMTEMLTDFDMEPSGKAYDVIFENPFLERSQEFYRHEAASLINEGDVSSYLKRVQKRIGEEEDRAQRYLLQSTLPKAFSMLDKEMLEHNCRTLLEMDSGLSFMINNKKLDDLTRLYQLYSRIPNGIYELKSQLARLILQRVSQINALEKAPVSRADSGSSIGPGPTETRPPSKPEHHLNWVSGMLSAIEEITDIWKRCFAKDRTIQMEMNNSFETGINEHPKSAEYISLFIDENLKRGLKGKSEEEVENLLDQAIMLFRFLKEKDIFDRYYKQHLAKRLLLGKSVGEDAERSMISKLKIECGYQFTSKLEGMFNDMRLSADITKDFHAKTAAAESSVGPVLNVSVLTSTFWPIASSLESALSVNYPSEIQHLINRFERFYLSRHSGRKLTWVPNMGNVDIKAVFEKGRKEINVSTLCMTVLLKIFNGSHQEPVSFETILNETGIPEPELTRVMQSLSLTKHKILLKSSKGKDIAPTDTFKFNAEFASPLNKIKIPVITSNGNSGSGNSVENEEERIRTLEKIDEARKHQTEAAIVRIMKSRKMMDHSSLVAEVIDQLKSRFSPSPVLVKKRIESLIEREYLDRSKDDIKKYIYRA